jgi:succinyl-CoA synthetase beta subunit
MAVVTLGGSAVIKGQTLTGGRGKAGAVKIVSSEDEAKSAAIKILGMSVKGYAVERLLVVERLAIRSEYYVAITIDRQAKEVVLIVSEAGGMDIEEIAGREPEKIRRLAMPCEDALSQWLSASFPEQVLLLTLFILALTLMG